MRARAEYRAVPPRNRMARPGRVVRVTIGSDGTYERAWLLTPDEARELHRTLGAALAAADAGAAARAEAA